MASNYFLLSAVFAVLLVTGHAASSSYSCITINGVKKCAYKDDPNGNVAGAAAGINGGTGVAGAGAGSRDNFNTDYQQIGNGENNGDSGTGNFQPFAGAGVGPHGGGSAVAVGAGGFPNNFPQFNGAGVGSYGGGGFPNNIPQFNGNPFDFVRNFMGNFGGNGQVPA